MLFPMELILQEVSHERYIEIPKKSGRYTSSSAQPRWSVPPLGKGWVPRRISTTKMKVFLRSGSHKANTAIPQAFYNKIAGTRP